MTSSLTVVGLGYVGLPMALEACRVGMRVSGLDSDPSVASGLTAGLSHVDDIDSTDIAEMLTLGFNATTDPGCIGDSDVIIICVPTPLDKDRNS